MVTHQTTVKGSKVAYLDQGQGPAIVLLHGFCGSSAYWHLVVPRLSESFRVIAPDLRGHGLSEAPAGPYTMEAIAEDTAALLDALELPEAVVFGHSMGGYAALAFAEKYPQRVRGLALIHSTARPDAEAAKENRLKDIETIRAEGIEPFIEGLVPKLFAPDHLDSMKDAVDSAKAIGRETSPEGAMAYLEAMRTRVDRNRVLREASYPVLLVAGSEDKVVQPEKTFSIERKTITPVTIKGAGHMSMYEAPDRLTNAMVAFLQSI